MKSFVITLTDVPESVASANRCIETARNHGLDDVQIFDAISPRNCDPLDKMKSEGLSTEKFENNQFSRYLNCISCFLSHYSLWEKSVKQNESILILEHDAVFVRDFNQVPINKFSKTGLLSIGKPSYGKFRTPNKVGINKLTSKKYLPGAHAYIISPDAAREIIQFAKKRMPQPTDVFLHIERFNWIKEFYPWIVEVDDHFTTVQIQQGCKVKHNYQKDPNNYQILDI